MGFQANLLPFNRATEFPSAICRAMAASCGKLAFATARVHLSLRVKRTQTLARDSVAIKVRIHAKRTSSPPSRAEGDFPRSAERPPVNNVGFLP